MVKINTSQDVITLDYMCELLEQAEMVTTFTNGEELVSHRIKHPERGEMILVQGMSSKILLFTLGAEAA